MKTFVSTAAVVGALLALSAPSISHAADAANGKTLFRQQCGVCHLAGKGDGEGGQGPSLIGVVGRKPASDPNFGSYTQAMMDATKPWTEDVLIEFLANPQKMYPGTAMPIRVGPETDRADLAAYLAIVKAAP